MNIYAATREEWNKIAPLAHFISFNELRPENVNTFDYCLVCADEEKIFAYATIIEMDKYTAYVQHSAALPGTRGTFRVKKIYEELFRWLKERYTHVTARVKNTNLPMLKLLLSFGFLVTGCDCYPDGVFLHLRFDRGND